MMARDKYADIKTREGSEDIVRTILVTMITLTTLSTITTLLRVISHLKFKKFGWGDVFAVLGWAFGFWYSFNLCWGTQFSLGRHSWNITEEMREAGRRNRYRVYLYTSPIAHNIGATCIKISILLFYMRIVHPAYLTFRRICITTLIFVALSGIGIVVPSIISCLPLKANWDYSLMASAQCVKVPIFYKAASIIFAVGDILVLFLMVPIITMSTLPTLAKMQALCVFLLASIATVAGVFRIYLTFDAFYKTKEDIGFYTGQTMLGGGIEFQLAIICASIPAIKKLLHGKLGPLSLLPRSDEEENLGNKGFQSPDSAYSQGVEMMMSSPTGRGALAGK